MKNHRQKQDYEAMEPSIAKTKIFGQHFGLKHNTNFWQTVGRQSADRWPTVSRPSADSRPTVNFGNYSSLLPKQVRDMTNNHEIKRKQLMYKAMDPTKKQDMLKQKAEQYKTMDSAKKHDLLNEKAEQYKTILMNTDKKQDLLKKKVEQYKRIATAKNNIC